MDSQVLRDKVAFFEELDALNEPIDEEDDRLSKEEEDFRAKCRAIFSSRGKSSIPPPQPAQPPRTFHAREATLSAAKRSFSAPTPAAGTSHSPIIIEATPEPRPSASVARNGQLNASAVSFVEETPLLGLVRAPHPLLQRSATLPFTRPSVYSGVGQSPSMASSMRKRKRPVPAVEVPPVPESEQILKGLALFYIPNDDIAPARKVRIRKAQGYGAQWVRDVRDASHVIVDSCLSYSDIQKILPLVPGVRPIVTNDTYPIDCITHRALLNANQPRYRIAGFPIATNSSPPSGSPPQSGHFERSLAPKDRVRRSGSLPKSGESSAQGDMVEVSQTQTSAENNSDNPNNAEQPQRGPSSSPRVEDSMTRPAHSSQPAIHDELSDYIEIMMQYKDLPLDAEEDDDDGQSVIEVIPASETDTGSEDERAHKKRPHRRDGKKDIAFQDLFACNRGGTLDKSEGEQNPNARTIEVLKSMCEYYSRINDQWRTVAYRKGINTLRQQTSKITTEEEAFRLPNIGRRLAAKIEEIVNTNKLRRLEHTHDDPRDRALATFLGIYGVGTTIANRWLAQGFRTLEDLRCSADLSPNQRLGIDYYDDLNTRIPRAEVTALGAYVMREAAAMDPAIELIIGGSYRRGSDSSGDIDFIVTKRGTTTVAGDLVAFLEELIRVLTAKEFLVATLAALHSTQRPSKDGPGSKWHGCCVLPPSECKRLGIAREKPIWRRIDFLLVPESQYGAALIYFTGNDIFNRSMRLLASKKNMRLNQRGLYKEVMRGPGRTKVTEGELVEGRDERRIFEILGVKWREPSERWC